MKKLKTDTQTTPKPAAPYRPHTCAELEAYEFLHVGHPHDFQTYPDFLFLKPNHHSPLVLNNMISAVKARKIAHDERRMTDLSQAVCYGTTHKGQPYPVQGAYVVYKTAYPYKNDIQVMYWCSKCASKRGMRGDKKQSKHEYKQNKGIIIT